MKRKNRFYKNIFLLSALLLPAALTDSQATHATKIPDYGHNHSVLSSIADNGNAIPKQNDKYWQLPELNSTSLKLVAGGDDYQLKLFHAADAEYSLTQKEKKILSLSSESPQSVIITPLAKGEAILTVTATGYNNEETTLTCNIEVSDISLQKQSVDISLNGSDHNASIAMQGVSLNETYYEGYTAAEHMRGDTRQNSRCSLQTENSDVADAVFDNGKILITGYAKGHTTINVSMYGKSIPVNVSVRHYELNKYTINTYEGSPDKVLYVKDSGNQNVTWSSSRPGVARISQKGIIKIKGTGTAKITAKVNGQKLMCIVSVSSRTAHRVVKQARIISGQKHIRYSQALRMSENYYDCSSLVWRCYKPYGILFGATNNYWAPTAAEEGRWCARKNKLVAKKSVDILSFRLVPGDTIYYSFSGNNGRYKNIDHTAIFAGYKYDASSNTYYGTVLEASSSRNSVVERMYYPGASIRLIGRPSR